MIVLILTVETKIGKSAIISPKEENTWSNMSPTNTPPSRADFEAVYDVKSDKIIICCGLRILSREKYQDTWSYDYNTNTWTNLLSINTPLERNGHSMAYDEESDRIILFSGLKTGMWDWICWNETWSFDFESNSWTFMDPSTQPIGRCFADIVYDKGSDRIILFGGFCRDNLYADTWAYDFNANEWTNMTPPVQPSPRWGHKMIYDEESDLVILFGGSTALPPFPVAVGDTWTYDYDNNTWTNINPSTSPPELINHGLAYDSKSDRTILFGGANSNLINQGETWVYNANTNTWINEIVSTTLSPRRRFGMVYDKESDRIILFGGCFDDFTSLNETWVYDYQSTEENTTTSTTTITSTPTTTTTSTPGPKPRIPSFPIELGLFSLVIFAIRVKRRSIIKKDDKNK